MYRCIGTNMSELIFFLFVRTVLEMCNRNFELQSEFWSQFQSLTRAELYGPKTPKMYFNFPNGTIKVGKRRTILSNAICYGDK